MDIEELRKARERKGYTLTKISELSGVPLRTVQNVFEGINTNPRVDTADALRKVVGLTAEGYLFTDEETRLLIAFHALTPTAQATIIEMVEMMGAGAKKKRGAL